MQALNARVTCLDKEISELSSQQAAYRHLLTIPGVGPLIAAAFISEVDAAQFGRETKAVLCNKKWQSQPEDISHPWCTFSNALRKKTR